MKRFRHLFLPLCLLVICSIFLPTLLQAQGDPGNPCNDPQLYCPIDGGLTALLAVGVGYGIKKVREARKSHL